MDDLSDSREVMMSKAPMSISLFIYIILGVIISAVVWASVGQIDEYSKASGEIRPNKSAGTLTAGNGGKIAKINFKDGDFVSVGDILIEFEAMSIAAQKSLLEAQKKDEQRKIENYNLLKESVETGQNLFSNTQGQEFYYQQYENYILSVNQQISQIDQSNDKLASSKKELELSIKTVKEKIAELNVLLRDYNKLYDLVSIGDAYTGNNSQLLLSYDDYKINLNKAKLIYGSYKNAYDELVNKKSESTQEMIDNAKFQMDNAEQDMLSVTSKFLVSIYTTISDIGSQIDAQKSQLQTYELQLTNLSTDNSESEIREKAKYDTYLSINNSIEAVNAKITEIDSQLININNSTENSVIKAQTTGTLVFSQDLISGDTVSAEAQIGRIVPNGDQLKVSLYIPEKDIASIKRGMSVEYILNAISVSEFGKSEGKILSVSADSFFDETSGQKLYKAEASINKSMLANKNGETRILQAGMIVEARVISGSQSILSWALDRLNLRD
jgi:multidrug efflux pump subunit AcrA (membrane-fusion protein)